MGEIEIGGDTAVGAVMGMEAEITDATSGAAATATGVTVVASASTRIAASAAKN